jgi:SAM-dependent methyltransferase
MLFYRSLRAAWPKTPPPLSAEQLRAREQYMLLWHQQLPRKYAAIERFNHGFASQLPLPAAGRTLEIGAGLGEHARFEDLSRQQYWFLEYREEFCEALRRRYPLAKVIQGDIHQRQDLPDAYFNRVVAIHVLEHLLNLPLAVAEIDRLLADDGFFDVVIPCEGGLAHSLGRKISAERLFRREFRMDFTPIRKNEHVSTFREIMTVLQDHFNIQKWRFFPMGVPYYQINFCAGFRLAKKKSR